MNAPRPTYDCLVVGGGPAGSTVAAIVADAGFRVLLVEREKFPRPHVGESLMPATYGVFKRLGVLENLQRSKYPRKVGVQFVTGDGRESQPFLFRTHDPHESSETWHVNRAEFDQMLFETAAKKGAECCEQTRALDVVFDNKRATAVVLQAADGTRYEASARVIVDATGQQAVLANKLKLRQVNPHLRKAAIWGHFRGGLRDTSGGGVKTIILHTQSRNAWFWYIPQADDVVSVGVVGDRDFLLKGRGAPAEIFAQERANCPGIVERLAPAEPIDELVVDKEFSYTTSHTAGDGWVLVGDAWGFIDPIYSSGVFFALKSGELAADCIVEALRTNDTTGRTLGRWEPDFKSATNWIRKLVHAFYSNEFRVGQFVKEFPQHQGRLTDLLIGRIFEPGVGEIFDDLEPWLAKRLEE